MAQDYPKMIYKYMDKSSYKIVHSFEEEEASVKEGYGESKIMLRGEKPEGLEVCGELTKEELKKAEKPKRKRRTSAEVAKEKKPEVVEPKEEPKEEESKGE